MLGRDRGLGEELVAVPGNQAIATAQALHSTA
jgi:hypothetical protein